MGKTLKDLALALLNATLILVALCLFLAWKLSATTGQIVENLTDSLEIVHPLQEQISATRDEIKGLRADISDLATSASGADPVVLKRLEQRLDMMNQRFDAVQDDVAALRDTPRRLMDQSLEAGGGQVLNVLQDLRACYAQPDQAPQS